MTRRNFIKLSSLTAASISPIARIGGTLGVTSIASELSASATFDDYKALVVVFLDGGNDAMNMVVPTDKGESGSYDTTAFDQYKEVRYRSDAPLFGSLDVKNVDLYSTNFNVDDSGHYTNTDHSDHPYVDPEKDPDVDGKSDSAIRSYRVGSYHTTQTTKNDDGTYTSTDTKTGLGINSMMPEIAAMYKKGKISIVSNVGTLVEPITKEEAIIAEEDASATPKLPVFLFAHNHQKRAVYTAQAEQLGATGWAGRLADNWLVNDPIGLNITYGDVNRLLIGRSTSPLKMPTTAPVSFKTAYREPINRAKGDPFEAILNRFNEITKTNAFSDYYSNKIKKAGDLSTSLITAMESKPIFADFTAKNTYGDTLFTFEDENGNAEAYTEETIDLEMHDDIREDIFQQFRAATELIKVGKDQLNHPRQIIYIRMPGYDTHSGQSTNHLNNLRALSMAMGDFQKSLEEMGMDEEVLSVTMSDFGRTLKNNSNGTDHGWGGHSFIMTGNSTFNGGNVYGTIMDDLRLEGVNTFTEKGRIIPTTSIEQMVSPCLKWFGVSDDLMPTLLPNLVNFSEHENTANLAGLFS